MSGFTQIFSIAASGMNAQSQRLQHVSENIANNDTPGYRKKAVSFEQVLEFGQSTGQVQAGRVSLSDAELTRIFDPGHPMADTGGYYNGSNVDLVIEIADAREAQRSYEANLKVFEQARKMSSSLSELLRR
ncbi:flagellar basal body rod protein FlgC [Algirhabdus cladophorae]|uniref:flagellar basal body rod protein FlgC n=1 Tax=Algirhabdus cladophorae TaxID=3377108 RepID=UPI003B84A6B2